MRNLTVKSRLIVVTASVAVVLLGVGGAGLAGVSSGAAALRTMFEGRAQSLQAISTINEIVAETTFSLSDAILDPSADKSRLVTESAAAHTQQVDALMKDYLAKDLSTEERQLARQFSGHWSTLRDQGFVPAARLLSANNLSEAQWVQTQTIDPVSKSVKAEGAALRKLELVAAQQEYEHSRTTGHVLEMLVIALIVAALAIVALLCASLARSLFAQLGGEPTIAAHIANQVASGDLSVKVPVRAGDTRSVLFAMEKMRERLANIIGDLRSSIETIADATAGIADGNNRLAGRTEEQAASLQETSASMEQLASTVKSNAEHAIQARSLAGVASAKAEDGDAAAKDAAQRMTELSKRSARVSEITSTIEGIAFQTNLLALNAAVEAARAGAHGRGFAVVAKEVRSLADRSSTAAREIDTLIDDMTSEVDISAAAVGKAGKTIVELIGSVRGVSQLLESIAAASTEQSAGIDQVNAAVSMMDRTTQQNASFAHDGVQAASALEAQARQLRSVVRTFEL